MTIKNRGLAASLLLSFLLLLQSAPSYADSASVLPKGIFGVSLNSNRYLTIDTRYGPNGDVEDAAIDYNANLNSNVFSGLRAVELGFGLPPGFATIGRSHVSFDIDVNQLNFGLLYGITDRLTGSLTIPYFWVRNRVKARLDTSAATVGKSAIGNAFGAPFVPLAGGGPFGDATRLSTEDVLQLLGQGLDVDGNGTIDLPGFGFKRFKTWSGKGLGDIESVLKYQYLKTKDWRLAFAGGARFPAGRQDDPDHLADQSFGSGAYALLFRFNHDYVVSNLWKETKVSASQDGPERTEAGDLVLNGTFRYELVLPDKVIRRLQTDPNNPIATGKKKLRRNIGDMFQFEAAANYALTREIGFSALYNYTFKNKDGYRGEGTKPLEEESRATMHSYIMSLSYSTISLYMEKKFPVPFIATVSYRNRFNGSNNPFRSQYIGLGLQFFF